MEAMRIDAKELLKSIKEALSKADELLKTNNCQHDNTIGIITSRLLIEPTRLTVEIKKSCNEIFVGEHGGLVYLYHVKPKSIGSFTEDESRYPDISYFELKKLEKLSDSSDEAVIYFDFPFTIIKIGDELINL